MFSIIFVLNIVKIKPQFKVFITIDTRVYYSQRQIDILENSCDNYKHPRRGLYRGTYRYAFDLTEQLMNDNNNIFLIFI